MNYNTIDPLSSAKRVLGKKLLLWAWIIEITTVLIAIFIGLHITYSEYGERLLNENLKGEYLNILTITLPFLIVAIIGLFKIPFIYIIRTYNNKLIKFLFFIILILLTLITFEILRHGLEQHFNKPNIKIEQAQRNILDTNKAIESKKYLISMKELLTKESILKEEDLQLNNAKQAHKSNLEQINSDITKYTVYVDDDPSKQIEILKTRINIYKENLNVKLDNLKDVFLVKKQEEANIFTKNKNTKLQSANDALKKLNDKKEELKIFEDNHSFYSIENDKKIELLNNNIKIYADIYNKKLKEYQEYDPKSTLSIDEDLKALQDKYNSLITKAEIKIFKIENLLLQKHENRSKLVELNNRISEEKQRYSNEVSQIKENTLKQYMQLKDNKKDIESLSKEIKELYKDKDEMITYIDNIYGQSLIYIATKKLYQKSQVSQKEVQMVSTILFAITSFVLTFLGIILSMSAFMLIFHDYERILQPKERHIKIARRSQNWLHD